MTMHCATCGCLLDSDDYVDFDDGEPLCTDCAEAEAASDEGSDSDGGNTGGMGDSCDEDTSDHISANEMDRMEVRSGQRDHPTN